jgi:hypothetical protein
MDKAARMSIEIASTQTRTGIRIMIDTTTTHVGQCCFAVLKSSLSMPDCSVAVACPLISGMRPLLH